MTIPELGPSDAILNSDFIAVLVVENRRVLVANGAAHRLYGYAPGELIGQSTRIFFPDEASYLAFGKEAYGAVAEGGRFHTEFQQRRKDGSLGWFEFNISPFAGRPGAFVGAIVDRSAQRQALEQLEAQAGILAAIADGVNIVSRDGQVLYTNRAFDTMLGYAPGELLGQPIAIVNAAEADRSAEALAGDIFATLAATGRWSGDILNRRKDGSTLWTNAQVTAQRMAPWGDVWLSVQRDITVRRELENRLLEQEERLNLALLGSGLTLWDWHIPQGEVFGGDGLQRLLGYQPQELGTREADWRALIASQDRVRFERAVNEHLQGETSAFQSRHRLRHKDGHWVPVEARGKVTRRDARGNPLRMTGTLLDLSNLERLHDQGIDLLKRVESLIHRAVTGAGTDPGLPSPAASLTQRQRQILSLVASGLTSAEIGHRLGLATNTVVSHRRNLMAKLDLHRASDVTRFAVEQGLLPSPKSA